MKHVDATFKKTNILKTLHQHISKTIFLLNLQKQKITF